MKETLQLEKLKTKRKLDLMLQKNQKITTCYSFSPRFCFNIIMLLLMAYIKKFYSLTNRQIKDN